ncbi:MAG: acyl-CoA dehydrogenase family protein, partial [Myxococcota bacterium]
MDFEDTPQEAEFRKKARAWLDANAELRDPDEAGGDLMGEREDEGAIAAAKAWQAKKFDEGWAVLTWPKEFGGQGAGRVESVVWGQEEAKFKTPANIYGIGHGMLGPTLMAHATDETKAKYVKEMARGQVVWCQLFSEPAAGSDLAGLRTSAVKDGDDWVINGQKIWSTGAHYSDYGMIVTRTDPNVPKHAGLTYFVVDMKAPGVEIRPIKQINGGSGFNEVFFTDVRIPDADRVGAVGDGWRVAITTLMNERVSIGAGGGAGRFKDLLQLARETQRNGRPAIEDGAVRQKLAEFYVKSKGLAYTGYRTLTALSQGATPGPEGS